MPGRLAAVERPEGVEGLRAVERPEGVERLGAVERLAPYERLVDPERAGLDRLTLELCLALRPELLEPPPPPPLRCPIRLSGSVSCATASKRINAKAKRTGGDLISLSLTNSSLLTDRHHLDAFRSLWWCEIE